MIRRKGARCDPCCNDWKEKIKFLWERYAYTVRSIKLNGTVKWPDGDGQIDLGTIDAAGAVKSIVLNGTVYTPNVSGRVDLGTIEVDVDIPTTSGVNGYTEANPVTLKDFVNSSIATNTANYISDNGQPFTDVADLPTTGVTNNDYAFVTGTDAAGNTFYDRYKYNADTGTWSLEYRLNNSSFTAEQWNAIQSGITAGKVATYDAYAAQIQAKQDKAVGVQVTLSVTDWSNNAQTVSATGVTASNKVFVSPNATSYLDYANAQIRATAQGAGTLTFVCETVPTNDVDVDVVIL